jgi:hypothetical protein
MADPSRATELDLVVGSLITVRPDEDRAAYEEEREMIADVQEQLREEGIEVDLLSQPGVEVWEDGIETLGELYQLSRLATRLENNDDIADVLEDGPVITDDLDRSVTDVWDDLRPTRFPHLVNLQGINSYYLPVDFDQPIRLPFENDEGEEDEAFFGSSSLLLRELTDLEELMRKANVPTRITAYRCLQKLREAALQSTRNGLPIIVW